jgi:transcription elongation GreA/GreB family factor
MNVRLNYNREDAMNAMTLTSGSARAGTRVRPPPIHAKTAFGTDAAPIRGALGDILNGLGALLMERMRSVTDSERVDPDAEADTERLQMAIRRLGSIASGLGAVDPGAVPTHGAGYGSEVEVLNLDTGHAQTYTLLIGSVMDLAANHVSLASPIGQALAGRVAGDEVVLTAPRRQMRLQVLRVQTLWELLDSLAMEFPHD